ncbi:MAG: CAP domain-containing protein [Gaiellaceae bacterium]
MKARSARVAVVAIVAACSALGLTGTALPSTNSQHRATVALTAFDYGVLAQLNHVRLEHGLVPLHLNIRLSESADEHSREMGSDGYFAHASFDGTTYWKRIEQWYRWSGYQVWSVGENLLWSSPDLSPATALKMWMQSPEHRANILNPNWREIGIAAVHSDGAPGTFGGLPVTIITTDFGVRATN